jgi:hypothetical protein
LETPLYNKYMPRFILKAGIVVQEVKWSPINWEAIGSIHSASQNKYMHTHNHRQKRYQIS